MANGISSDIDLTSYATALKQDGIDFVFRYYCKETSKPQKRLTLAEAQALCAVGLQIGVVYEESPTSVSYFSGLSGHQDGVNAYSAALNLHQPAGSAIYFSVDYDALSADIPGPILDYFRGVDQGMRDAGRGVNNYTIGVYGSGAVCDLIKGQCPFVRYSWLAGAQKWGGSASYSDWDVRQSKASSALAGLSISSYEPNEAKGDFGGFAVPAPWPGPPTATV